MKTRLIACLSFVAILAAGLSVSLINSSKEAYKVEGYDTSTLPTTIDLNDSTASDIRSYYSSLNNKTQSERQGTNLLKNLKTILKNGQKYYSYDSGNAIWQIYEIADRDWDKSPASSTTYGTYNSSTNKITGYSYGTSASSSKNNPYIHALYINRNVTNQVTAWDDHQQTQWGINREHVWPKAEGFETEGSGGARGDPMHLMAGNGYANNKHSNYFYGYVNKSSSYTDCGSKYSNLAGNLLGKSKTLGGSTSVFEPQDSDKGDIARAIFYMVARYNYYSGSDSDGIDSNNPNLVLTQSLSDWSNTGYSSTTSTKGYMGVMTDLLAWHHADPVDSFEIHRNNLLYKNFTNNRNPFIDFPEWADFIWGSVDYDGSTYKSHSTTPTGYATPSSDTINGYNPTGTVNVTGVSLNKTSASMAVNGTLTLTASVTPANATNKNVTWSSSNTSVATVSSSGVVTAKATGDTTITVRTSDGGYTATCAVSVKALQSISVSGQITTFSGGDEFEFGGTVTANYGSDIYEDVTSSATFDGYDMSSTGQQTVTVSYGGKTTTYTINITESEEGLASGSVVATNGAFEGWTPSGTGDAYKDGSARFDSTGDTVYKFSIFTGDVSDFMTSLKVTINGKHNSSTTGDPDGNIYKVEAISGDANNIIVKSTLTKQGADTFGTSYKDVDFDFSSGLAGTTGIRFTYSTKSSGNLAVKSISWSATYEQPTSISAVVKNDRVFYAGEIITENDITVTTNLGNDITALVDFEDYQFTYSDAPSGGAAAHKEFPIYFKELDTTLDVTIKRKAYQGETSDTLNNSFIGVSGTYYKSWSGKSDQSSAVYAGYSAGGSGDYVSIQLNSSGSGGIVSTTSGGNLKSVTVTFNSYTTNNRNVDIYYKDTAYDGPSDLYSETTRGTLAGSITETSTTHSGTINISGSHQFIGIRSQKDAIYIDSIVIIYAEEKSASNVSNYIMYEDTTNQCNSKTDVAIGYFNNLSTSEKTTFMTSDDYVISTARERFNAWLRNQGKSIAPNSGDYVIQSNNKITLTTLIDNKDISTVVAVILSAFGLLSIGGYFLFRRKKED